MSQIPERPKSPRCLNFEDKPFNDDDDESSMSVSEKVTHFISTAEKVSKPSKEPSSKEILSNKELIIDESLKEDDCLLSVSDKVTKFITSAEKLKTVKLDDGKKKVGEPRGKYPEKEIPREKSPEKFRQEVPRGKSPEKLIQEVPRGKSPEKLIQEVPRRKSPEKLFQEVPRGKSPEKKIQESPRVKISEEVVETDCVQIETEEDMFKRRGSSPQKERSPKKGKFIFLLL